MAKRWTAPAADRRRCVAGRSSARSAARSRCASPRRTATAATARTSRSRCEFAPADLDAGRGAAALALAARCRARCSRCARRPSRPRCRATCARSPCAKARPCRPARSSRGSTPPTSTRSCIERIGALESAKAQLAMAEKTRTTNQTLLKQNFISQNAFDNSESSFNVAQGSRQVGRGAGADRAQRAARRRRDLAADRHRRQAPRPAGREGRVRFAARHDRRPEGHGAAGGGAGGRRPGARDRQAGRARRSTASASAASPGRVERINPATEPGTRVDPRVRRHPEPRRRAARRHVRDRPHRARRERARADAAGDRRAHRGGADVSSGRSRTASS